MACSSVARVSAEYGSPVGVAGRRTSVAMPQMTFAIQESFFESIRVYFGASFPRRCASTVGSESTPIARLGFPVAGDLRVQDWV